MMIKEYQKELNWLKGKMIKAERFAKKLPIFKDEIIKRKLTGDENRITFKKNYLNSFFYLTINRSHHVNDGNRAISNFRYNKDYDLYLFKICVNSFSTFNKTNTYGLENIENRVNVFHFERINSTFYVIDENVEMLIKALVLWCKNATKKAVIDRINGFYRYKSII